MKKFYNINYLFYYVINMQIITTARNFITGIGKGFEKGFSTIKKLKR